MPVVPSVFPLALYPTLHWWREYVSQLGLEAGFTASHLHGISFTLSGLWVDSCQQNTVGEARLGGLWEDGSGTASVACSNVLYACWASVPPLSMEGFLLQTELLKALPPLRQPG